MKRNIKVRIKPKLEPLGYMSIPVYSPRDAKEITLLSIEEWEKAGEIIKSVPKLASYWWLRSPGKYSNSVAYVSFCGDIRNDGDSVYDTCVCVRPAFKIPNIQSKIGSKIFVRNTLCTVIDTDYALSDISICQHRFDKEINDYDSSEIKSFINSDKFKTML